jgi:predicted transcriptional regulator
MKARRFNIGVRGADERSNALRQALRRAAHGECTPHQELELYFENVEMLRQVLTEKRLELLLAITRNRPASVRELAELVGRDYKNVSTDFSLLERLGIVAREARNGKGRARTPTVLYDEIQVTIDLRQPHDVHTT